ncbi:MAG: hypothetical protein PHY45_11695 [Rhodocyclaceae bacterium]|nr:hypothetical protein [Rhodocyclaceae bacterium]
MDLHPIAQRIKTEVPALTAIGLAGDFQSALANLRIQTPAAFVLPGPERAGANEVVGEICQRVALRFVVALAVQNLRDMQGDAAQTDLDGIRKALAAALIGWIPPGAVYPVTYSSGRMGKWADGVLWWLDEFDTIYYLRA